MSCNHHQNHHYMAQYPTTTTPSTHVPIPTYPNTHHYYSCLSTTINTPTLPLPHPTEALHIPTLFPDTHSITMPYPTCNIHTPPQYTHMPNRGPPIPIPSRYTHSTSDTRTPLSIPIHNIPIPINIPFTIYPRARPHPPRPSTHHGRLHTPTPLHHHHKPLSQGTVSGLTLKASPPCSAWWTELQALIPTCVGRAGVWGHVCPPGGQVFLNNASRTQRTSDAAPGGKTRALPPPHHTPTLPWLSCFPLASLPRPVRSYQLADSSAFPRRPRKPLLNLS